MYEARARGLGEKSLQTVAKGSRPFAELQNRGTRYMVVGLLEATFSQFTTKLRDEFYPIST